MKAVESFLDEVQRRVDAGEGLKLKPAELRDLSATMKTAIDSGRQTLRLDDAEERNKPAISISVMAALVEPNIDGRHTVDVMPQAALPVPAGEAVGVAADDFTKWPDDAPAGRPEAEERA